MNLHVSPLHTVKYSNTFFLLLQWFWGSKMAASIQLCFSVKASDGAIICLISLQNQGAFIKKVTSCVIAPQSLKSYEYPWQKSLPRGESTISYNHIGYKVIGKIILLLVNKFFLSIKNFIDLFEIFKIF